MAWGQWLSPTGNVSGTNPVNNAFGAGESSYITAGTNTAQHAKSPWEITGKAGTAFNWYTKDDNSHISSPYPGIQSSYVYDHALTTPPSDIQLGGVENTVIKAYTGNGYALGWISVLNRTCATPCVYGPNDFPSSDYYLNNIADSYTKPTAFATQNPAKIYEFSFNKTNIGEYGVTPWPIPQNTDPKWGNKAPCGWALFQAKSPDANDPFYFEVSTHIMLHQWYVGSTPTTQYPWADHHISARADPANVPFGLYTSTVDGHYDKVWPKGHFNQSSPTTVKYPMDDKVPLVQFAGKDMVDGAALKNQSTYKLKSDAGHAKGTIDPDASPAWGNVATTQGAEFLTNYRRPTTIVIEGNRLNAPSYHQFNQLLYKDIKWKYDIDTVKAGPKGAGTILSQCCSGSCMSFEFEVAWNATTLYGATTGGWSHCFAAKCSGLCGK